MSNTITLSKMPVSVYSGDDLYHEGKKQRTLFVTVKDPSALPADLFAIKISQSKNPDLVGKPMFKFFRYRMNSTDPFSNLAPTGATPASDLNKIKEDFIKRFDKQTGAEFELNFKMHGKWGNIGTLDGDYILYDDDHYPDTKGDPDYYLKGGTVCDISLTPAVSHGNDYYQVNISTDNHAEDIFQMRGKGNSKYFGEDNDDEKPAGEPANDSDSGNDDWL